MSVFKELVIGNEKDIKTLVKRLHQFSEELKFTLSNLDEDNFTKEFIDYEAEKSEKVMSIKSDADALQIEFEDMESDTYARLDQSSQAVDLLVNRGEVVETMLSRMRLYGERIELSTGHVTFDTENFNLDMEGNATFSGTVSGGTLKLGSGFEVDESGHMVIEGSLVCNVLNPKKGTTSYGSVSVEGEDGVGNARIGQNLTGADAFIMESLSCRSLIELSDSRKKRDVQPVSDAGRGVDALTPVIYRYRRSGKRSMGFIAQEARKASEQCVYESDGELKISYSALGVLMASAIQENQKRIDRVRKYVEGRKNNVIL